MFICVIQSGRSVKIQELFNEDLLRQIILDRLRVALVVLFDIVKCDLDVLVARGPDALVARGLACEEILLGPLARKQLHLRIKLLCVLNLQVERMHDRVVIVNAELLLARCDRAIKPLARRSNSVHQFVPRCQFPADAHDSDHVHDATKPTRSHTHTHT